MLNIEDAEFWFHYKFETYIYNDGDFYREGTLCEAYTPITDEKLILELKTYLNKILSGYEQI
jgi:hypothetical protein